MGVLPAARAGRRIFCFYNRSHRVAHRAPGVARAPKTLYSRPGWKRAPSILAVVGRLRRTNDPYSSTASRSSGPQKLYGHADFPHQVHGQHLMEPHRRRRLRKVMHVATAMPIMLLQLSVHLGVRGGDATRLMEIDGD